MKRVSKKYNEGIIGGFAKVYVNHKRSVSETKDGTILYHYPKEHYIYGVIEGIIHHKKSNGSVRATYKIDPIKDIPCKIDKYINISDTNILDDQVIVYRRSRKTLKIPKDNPLDFSELNNAPRSYYDEVKLNIERK